MAAKTASTAEEQKNNSDPMERVRKRDAKTILRRSKKKKKAFTLHEKKEEKKKQKNAYVWSSLQQKS